MTPFLSILTHTFRRPDALVRCLASVGAQTEVAHVQHVVAVDHVGIGVANVYADIPIYAPALTGEYVLLLNDDNALADPTVVADLMRLVEPSDPHPPIILGRVELDGQVFPINDLTPKVGPVQSYIDLANLIVRRDVWQAECAHYGRRYEGDFDFALHLWELGIPFLDWPRLVAIGSASHGAAE